MRAQESSYVNFSAPAFILLSSGLALSPSTSIALFVPPRRFRLQPPMRPSSTCLSFPYPQTTPECGSDPQTTPAGGKQSKLNAFQVLLAFRVAQRTFILLQRAPFQPPSTFLKPLTKQLFEIVSLHFFLKLRSACPVDSGAEVIVVYEFSLGWGIQVVLD